jgi:immunity protein 35 of polymorphic toxin system
VISAEDARRIAEEWLLRHVPDADGNEIVLKGESREEPFGWVFFYNTRRFLEEGDWSYALIGNAPIVVLRASGEVRPTGTALPLDHYLQEYRQQTPSEG